MMNLSSALATLMVAVTLLGVPADARACMPGFAHPQKELIIFWHEGTEILVWRAQVTPASYGGLRGLGAPPPEPRSQLAWVLAVPSEPLAYHVVDNEDFEQTRTWARALRALSPLDRAGGGGGIGSGGLHVGETVRAGEYDITPIQAEGDGAARELNAWLRRNRFPAANSEAANAYATEGATFLAVKARVRRGTNTIDLRPLGIAFRSPKIVIPVRLSADEAPFGLSATIFSTRIPKLEGALTHGFSVGALRPFGGPTNPPVLGRVSVVPSAHLPDAMRRLIAPLTEETPGFDRMLTGSLAVSLIAAQPLTIAVDQPDPVIELGDEVATDAPSGVEYAGYWDDRGAFVIGATPPSEDNRSEAVETTAETTAEEATSTQQPSTGTAATATDDDDGGLCRAAAGPPPGSWLMVGLVFAAVTLRRRR